MAHTIKLDESGKDKATCALCRRQVARYTCPTCNIPYCSLSCFRSGEHDQCSEGFYKRELESEIHSKPSASLDEKKRMMEVLRRLEEENGDEGLSDDEQEENELAQKLAGINIDSADPSLLWEALSPAQREVFQQALDKSDLATAQSWLRGLDVTVRPWWEDRNDIDDCVPEQKTRYGKRPAMFNLPESLLRKHEIPGDGPPLLYNICVVLICYSFVSRHLGISPLSQTTGEQLTEEALAARHLLSELIPHVTDRRSRALFTSMDAVVLDLWPRLIESGKVDRVAFSLCVNDACTLLIPKASTVIEVVEPGPASDSVAKLENLPQSTTLYALSDLIALFRTDKGGRVKETPTSAKLAFYALHIASVPSPILASFASEIAARAKTLEAERKETMGPEGVETSMGSSRSRPSTSSTKVPPKLVEEL